MQEIGVTQFRIREDNPKIEVGAFLIVRTRRSIITLQVTAVDDRGMTGYDTVDERDGLLAVFIPWSAIDAVRWSVK